MLTRPRLTKFIDRWIEIFALVFVVLTIWSLVVVLKSGLNLFVYDTCNPRQSQSCSLGAKACSIDTHTPSFWQTLKEGRPDRWIVTEVSAIGETISLIPSRLKEWHPAEYHGANQSYYRPYDNDKLEALEVIDPSCQFCARMFANIKEARFDQRYNLTYIAFPIPDSTKDNGYKFKHSYLITSYLEAIKMMPLAEVETPVDWQILERLFTEAREDGWKYQDVFNLLPEFNEERAASELDAWLLEFGYDAVQIGQIKQLAQSEEVGKIIEQNKSIVNDRIHTVNIPTIIYDGNRHDGVIEVKDLLE